MEKTIFCQSLRNVLKNIILLNLNFPLVDIAIDQIKFSPTVQSIYVGQLSTVGSYRCPSAVKPQ